jgi:hypothetical protein
VAFVERVRSRIGAAHPLMWIATALMLSMSVAAWHDVSQAFDSGYYHLPFAARLAGVFSADDYVFSSENRARFGGFPLLGEFLQGVLWRVTGRPQGANFLCLLSAPALAFSVRSLLADGSKLPWSVLLLGFMGIPLVMMHATSVYVDLPASAALAGAFCRVALLPTEQLRKTKHVLLVCALTLISANMRLQHLPACALVLLLLLLRVFAVPRSPSHALGWRMPFLIVTLALPMVFFAPLKNLVRFGNPVYPVKISLFGQVLPGVEERYSFAPTWLTGAPQPVRFFASLLEMGLPPLFPATPEAMPQRYSVDQFLPADHPGSRMGGTLHIAMIAFSLLFLFGVWRVKERRRIALCFAALTALTSMLPQSHELRYTLYWPLSLAALAILFGYTRAPRVTAALSVLLPSIMILHTRGSWVYPTGSTFPELLQNKVNNAHIQQTPQDGTLCSAEAPRIFLYAAKFHQRRYTVQEADEDGVCRAQTH